MYKKSRKISHTPLIMYILCEKNLAIEKLSKLTDKGYHVSKP